MHTTSSSKVRKKTFMLKRKGLQSLQRRVTSHRLLIISAPAYALYRMIATLM